MPGTVNGVRYDFASLTMEATDAGVLMTIDNVNYGGKRDVEPTTDNHGVPDGNEIRMDYEGPFDCDVAYSQYKELAAARAGSGGVLGGDPYDVSLSFALEGEETVSDSLVVRITEVKIEGAKEKEIRAKLTGKQLEIGTIGGHPVWEPEFEGFAGGGGGAGARGGRPGGGAF